MLFTSCTLILGVRRSWILFTSYQWILTPKEHPCLYSIAGFLPGAKPGSVFAYMHEASSRASHSAGVGAGPVCGSACILSAANTRVQGVVLVNSDCRHSPQNANQCFWGAQKHTHALTPRAAIMKMDFWVLEARYEKGKSFLWIQPFPPI